MSSVRFWCCLAWPTEAVEQLARTLQKGDEIEIISFDNDDGAAGAPLCTLSRWHGRVMAPADAALNYRCAVKYVGIQAPCSFPDPAVRHYAMTRICVHRRGKAVPLDPGPLVPTIIPIASTRANRLQTKRDSLDFEMHRDIATRLPSTRRLGLGLATAGKSSLAVVSIFAFASRVEGLWVDGELRMGRVRVSDQWLVPASAVILLQRSDEMTISLRFLSRIPAEPIVCVEPETAQIVLVDLNGPNDHGELIVAHVARDTVEVPAANSSKASVEARVVAVVPGIGLLFSAVNEGSVPTMVALVASSARCLCLSSNPVKSIDLQPAASSDALLGCVVRVVLAPVMPNRRRLLQNVTLYLAVEIHLSPSQWLGVLEGAAAAVSMRASVADAPQVTEGMRCAAHRLGVTDATEGAVLHDVNDEPHGQAMADMKPDTESVPVGSWVCRGRSVQLYFHPTLDIYCSIRSRGMEEATAKTANALPPMVVGGTAMRVELHAAWIVNFVTAELDVVDEDGDPIPTSVLAWSIEDDEQNPALGRRPVPQPPLDNPSETWQPFVVPSLSDRELRRKVAGYTVRFGDVTLTEDGATIRLRLRLFALDESFLPTDDDAAVLVPSAPEPNDGDSSPLCVLLSRPVIVRSSAATHGGSTESSSPVVSVRQPVVVAEPPSSVAVSPTTGQELGSRGYEPELVTQEQVTQELAPEDSPVLPDGRAAPRFSALAPGSASHAFWSTDVVPPDLNLSQEVFVDPGRCNQLLAVTVSSLVVPPDTLPKSPHDPAWHSINGPEFSSAYFARNPPMVREVLVLDINNDVRLAAIVRAARDAMHGTLDVFSRAETLTWFAASVMGGPSIDWNYAETQLLALRKSLDTRRTQPSGPPIVGEAINKERKGRSQSAVRRSMRGALTSGGVAPRCAANVVALGSIWWGLCRHRALLLKLLCDVYRVPCYLVRGDYVTQESSETADRLSGSSTERHTWVIVVTRGEMWIADPTIDPMGGLRPWPNARYIPAPALESLRPNFVKLHDLRLTASLRVTLMEECGSGVSAIVRRCLIGGLSCAIKLPRHVKDQELLRNELLLMQRLVHCPNVVQVFGWRRGIVMEYMPLSLLSFLNHMTLRQRRVSRMQRLDILVGVLTALNDLHNMRMVHRDVKAENILIAVNRCEDCRSLGVYCERCTLIPKLTDFADAAEISVNCTVHPPTAAVGTVPYCAPEVECGAPFSFAADLWSVGILALELLLMELPRSGTVEGTTVMMNYFAADGGVPSQAPGAVSVFVPLVEGRHSSRLAVLVKECLSPVWSSRPTAAEALTRVLQERGEAS